ncbi:MAG: DUF3037 domain-containing protein [Luteibaculaceae bacterium]
MKKFQYQIVRYTPDRVTGEFVNVGIIVYQQETNFLQGKFITKYSRISQFFTDVNGHHIVSSLKHFEKELSILSERLTELFTNYRLVSEITSSILPQDDSALTCSEVLFGIDINPIHSLDDLYERLVVKHFQDTNKDQKDDKYVWKKVYKQYFDKYQITDKLKSFSVKTSNDEIEFDKAWKNGVWNCYQTVSFDLKRTDAIKNKVYRWSGILNELEHANEELHLYFLTIRPTKNKQLIKFIEDTLSKRLSNSVKVTLIYETQADKFVASVKKEIEAHHN